ncbi:MAG TPA: CBS domain-containing protein [Polyangiaceae bacterium]
MNIPRLVGDLMSRDVLSLSEDQDLLHIDDTMRLFRFRHMPVTNDGRLVGLVTQRDLLRVSASSLLPSAREQTDLLAKRCRVRDIMTHAPKAVGPDTRLRDAAHLMQHEKLGCLPVVNADNVLVGILTEADFLRLVVQLLERDFSEPPEPLTEGAPASRAGTPRTLESLTVEHAIIRRALDALGVYATRLEKDPSTGTSDLGRFAAFFENFAELWHHGKEEDVLLPALVACGFAWDVGPLARVRQEHDHENYLWRLLSQAATQEGAWSPEDRRHALASIRTFVDFERAHMEREELVLYKAAAERLSPVAISDMERRFKELEGRTFGSGTYERVKQDAEALFRQYLTT